jgi:hypothetical protein
LPNQADICFQQQYGAATIRNSGTPAMIAIA